MLWVRPFFSLTFSIEAVILVKIGLPSSWTLTFEKYDNDNKLCAKLDLLEEIRDNAILKIVAY